MASAKQAFSIKRPHLDPAKTPEYEKQIKKDEHIKAFKNPPEAVTALSLAAKKKADTPIPNLIILAVWSGLFIALGGAAALTVGGGLQFVTAVKEANGTSIPTQTQITVPVLQKLGLAATFPVALMLILLLGGELFTGNTMVLLLGLITKRTTILDLVISWTISYFGNYAGAVLGAVSFWGMGTLYAEPYHSFMVNLAVAKTNTNFGINLLKGIPANFLVCAAVVGGNMAEDFSGKILICWWTIFTFAIAGFEHCIANMFFVTTARFYGAPLNYGTFIWQNLIPVTIGNIFGGCLFMAAVLWYAYYKPITTQTIHHFKHHKNTGGDIELGNVKKRKDSTN